MTFIQFLKELEQKLKVSNSYPMTKNSVQFFLNYRQLCETDKKIIFDAIRNDTFRNKDPLSLCDLWNEKNIFKLKF